MDFMLKQLLIVLALLAITPYIIGIVLTLLAKLRLLPLGVCGLVFSCFPTWAAMHRLLSIGLLAACALYPVFYWTLRFIRWKQEEQYYTNYLLATAKPRFTEEETAWMVAQREKKNGAVDGADYDNYDAKDEYWYNG